MKRLTVLLSLHWLIGVVKRFPLVLVLLSNPSFAMTLLLPQSGDIVGETERVFPQEGETLPEVGIRYGIGLKEMVKANPSVAPDSYLSSNTRILIPSRFTLPHGSREGIVINLSQYRLFYYPKRDNVVMTYPVGIGRTGWSTPLGVTKIVAKQANPQWHPTAKIRAYAEKNGFNMPDEFPPGLTNPLGKYALRLGWPGYLIHGTNRTDGIGDKVSAGCIRMLPEDIEYLFEQVKVGTKVRVVDQRVPTS